MSDQAGTGKTSYVVRPPVVSVMGHVDHGKTSILDAIRKTNVASREFAGITQHTGAYQVLHNGKLITFIDTPGHAAFSNMRARGGKAADIVVLVVAGEEGVKPQTKEAAAFAKAGGAQIIIAINKMDLPAFDSQKTKQQLAQEGLLTEDWGGDIVSVDVSAKTGQNLDKLLEAILAVAEMLNLKADENAEPEALIIESKLDRKRGAVVTAVVKSGTLSLADEVVAGGKIAKIKALNDYNDKPLKKAGPGTPVEILGFKDAPHVGDIILKKGSELEELTQEESHIEIVGKNTKNTLSLILKSDTQGTLEAVKASLAKLAVESAVANYSIKFLSSQTGDITEGDVLMAESTKAVILGFNVKITPSATDLADNHNVIVRSYKTIYELVEDAEKMLAGEAFREEARVKGRAQILKIFKLESGDIVLGCKVIAGIIKETSRVSIYDKDPADITKEDIPLYTGNIKKLKEGKNEIPQTSKGKECGILLKPQYENAQTGYFIEVR